MIFLLAIIIAFFSGSLPSAWLVSSAFCKKDIRLLGSGNPGASNVFRECGAWAGLITLFMDIAKGALPVTLASLSIFSDLGSVEFSWFQISLGIVAWLGHVFNPFFGFRGGKGVASLIGILSIIFPIGLFYSIASGLVVMSIYRWFSLGSLMGVSLLPIAFFFFLEDPVHARHYPLLVFILLAFIFTHWRHGDNIRRIIQGTENSFTLNKK